MDASRKKEAIYELGCCLDIGKKEEAIEEFKSFILLTSPFEILPDKINAFYNQGQS